MPTEYANKTTYPENSTREAQPYTKLGRSIGVEKAQGMGTTRRIGRFNAKVPNVGTMASRSVGITGINTLTASDKTHSSLGSMLTAVVGGKRLKSY
jgi:hypothetical protein